jgi:hypothetical protein
VLLEALCLLQRLQQLRGTRTCLLWRNGCSTPRNSNLAAAWKCACCALGAWQAALQAAPAHSTQHTAHSTQPSAGAPARSGRITVAVAWMQHRHHPGNARCSLARKQPASHSSASSWRAPCPLLTSASTPASTAGGFVGLVGATLCGPRMGRFEEGMVKDMQPHDMVFVSLGTFMLWFGWYGFNCGSAFLYNGGPSASMRAALCTTLAASSSGLTALLLAHQKTGAQAGLGNGTAAACLLALLQRHSMHVSVYVRPCST